MLLGTIPLGSNIPDAEVAMPAWTSSFGGSTADAFLTGAMNGPIVAWQGTNYDASSLLQISNLSLLVLPSALLLVS